MKRILTIALLFFAFTSYGQYTKYQLYQKIDQMSTYQKGYMQALSDSIVKSMALQSSISNIDNTSDANKPVSTAQQTALDAKQDGLVSGTNIKTINNESLLGSGNIAISGGISGLTTDLFPYASSPTTITNSGLRYAVGGAASLRPGTRLVSWAGVNSGTTEPFFYNHGKLTATTDAPRLAMPKGFVNINWSLNMVNNWTWDDTDQRAEPYDVSLPMIGWELGGEGMLSHYTAPAGVPATSFHELTRFGGGVDGLNGISPYTTTIPFNQFKSTIFAMYGSSTTPSAATEEAWWGGSGNAISGRLNPLLWLHSEERKGTSGAFDENEFARFEVNSPAGDAFGAQYFVKTGGTWLSKSATATGTLIGKIGGTGYDGTTYQNTADIAFIARGTISSGNLAQEIRFRTSATNTAGLATRFAIGHEVITWATLPLRFNHTSISTIPDYSAVFTTPVTANSTLGQMQALSSSTGGSALFGLSTTSTASSAIALALSGVLGATAPTAPAFVISGRKHNGTTGFADLAATEIVGQVRNNSTSVIEILGNGNTGFGVTTPHTRVQTTSLATSYAAKTTTYPITAADYTIEATSGTFTTTLPTAVGITGRIYVITNSGSGTITLATTSSQTFVNVTATPTTLSLAQFKFVQVQSNGANWLVISQN